MRPVFTAAMFGICAGVAAAAQTNPPNLVYEGEVRSGGAPVASPVDLVFTLFSHASEDRTGGSDEAKGGWGGGGFVGAVRIEHRAGGRGVSHSAAK